MPLKISLLSTTDTMAAFDTVPTPLYIELLIHTAS